jgi:hypothetical protein
MNASAYNTRLCALVGESEKYWSSLRATYVLFASKQYRVRPAAFVSLVAFI